MIPAIATVSLVVAALAVTTKNIYNVIPLAYSQQNNGATNATTATNSPIEQFKIEEHRFNATSTPTATLANIW